MSLGVVIADRSPFVRMAARGALEPNGITVLAEAGDAAGAWAAVIKHRPDAILFDAELDDGMVTLAALREQLPQTAMIVLSPDDSVARAFAAISAGACGFLPKDTSPEKLPDIIRGAVDGEAAIPRRVVRRLLQRIAEAAAGPAAGDALAVELTSREREVLERLARNMSDRNIGAELGVSEVTVRRHVATAARKLHAVRREDAVEAFRRMVA